jgi:hypothetical protein
MKHFKHGLEMSKLSESQVRRLMTQVYKCFPKVIKKQTPRVKPLSPSAVAANVNPSRIGPNRRQPPAPENLVNVSSESSDMPQLVKLTPVITTMNFVEAIGLADSTAAYVRKSYAKGDTKHFLIDSLPKNFAAKIRSQLQSMIKTMVHKMNATLEPVIECIQMGFCREGSSVAKQR